MSAGWERAFLVLGGIVGASGVALSALAAHLTGPGNLETASRFLLFHAPALLALAALIRLGLLHRLTAALAGLAIVLGLTCSAAISACGRSMPWRRSGSRLRSVASC